MLLYYKIIITRVLSEAGDQYKLTIASGQTAFSQQNMKTVSRNAISISSSTPCNPLVVSRSVFVIATFNCLY